MEKEKEKRRINIEKNENSMFNLISEVNNKSKKNKSNIINSEIRINNESENFKNNAINSEIRINDESKNFKNNITNFSYGVFITGIFYFFISGGINSFILTIILLLVVNENIFIISNFPYPIYHIFTSLSYSILIIRANFFNLFHFFSFCVNYYIYIRESIDLKDFFIYLITNFLIFLNYDLFSLLLLFIGIFSFIINFFKRKMNNSSKSIETCKKYERISILFFPTLFSLFIQIKGYECYEIIVLCIFILLDILTDWRWTTYYKQLIAYTFLGFCFKILEKHWKKYLFNDTDYNEKGVWINIFYYIFILILNI